MIDFSIAGAVIPGMIVLLPWPNWAWRRFHVHEVSTSESGEFVLMGVRAMDGDDAGIDVRIARSAMEPIHILCRNAQDSESLLEAMQHAEANTRKPRSSAWREFRYPDATDTTPDDRRIVCVWCSREFEWPRQRGQKGTLCSSECRQAKHAQDGRDRYHGRPS